MAEQSKIISRFLDSIDGVLSERLVSPLLPAFSFSWCVFNYKFLIVLFSGGLPANKFLAIHELYPTMQELLGWGVGAPLLGALFYIFVYPHPARWTYEYHLKRQRQLASVRHEIEQATLLTKEEADDVRRHYAEKGQEWRREREELTTQVRELEAQLKALQQPAKSIDESLISIYPSSLSENQALILETMIALEERGVDRATEHELRAEMENRLSVNDLRFALGELERLKLVQHWRLTPPEYAVTHAGRRIFAQHTKIQSESALPPNVSE